MAEQLDLTTPVTFPDITNYSVVRLTLDWPSAEVVIVVRANTGQHSMYAYHGAEATALMVAMNKMNFTTTSMQKKILQRLVTDGKLAGTISGSPD